MPVAAMKTQMGYSRRTPILYIYTSILKSKYELWKYNSDTSVSAFAMTISRRKSHLTCPSAAYFSTFATKNLAEIICNIQNITNFVDGDYDDGRLPTVDSKPLDVQRLCPTAHSSVAHAPAASAWSGGAMGAGRAWQRAQRRETPALQVLQNVFSWQGG